MEDKGADTRLRGGQRLWPGFFVPKRKLNPNNELTGGKIIRNNVMTSVIRFPFIKSILKEPLYSLSPPNRIGDIIWTWLGSLYVMLLLEWTDPTGPVLEYYGTVCAH